jgi:hypothetical protein
MAGKKLKKDRVTLALGKYKLHSRRNYKLFTKDWVEWMRTTKGLKGATIGNYKLSESLYDMVRNQGIAGRQAGNSGPDSEPWSRDAMDTLEEIGKLFKTQDYEDAHLDKLKALDKQMDAWSVNTEQGNGNAANILFTEPRNWDDEDGTIGDYQPVYGHYMTEKYCDYRNDWKNANLKPVSSDWYSYSKGEAKPPMWQAMYGGGNIVGRNSLSLHQIIKNAIKDLDSLEFELDPNTPIPVHGQGAAKLAMEIAEIRKMFKMMVSHEEYTTPSGNFATTRAASQIKNIPIMIHNQREVNLIKRIEKDLGAIPNDIDKIFITMSRRQMVHMAKLAGWEPHEDSVYMKRKKREAEEEEGDDEVRTSADIEIRDWRDIMKVNA